MINLKSNDWSCITLHIKIYCCSQGCRQYLDLSQPPCAIHCFRGCDNIHRAYMCDPLIDNHEKIKSKHQWNYFAFFLRLYNVQCCSESIYDVTKWHTLGCTNCNEQCWWRHSVWYELWIRINLQRIKLSYPPTAAHIRHPVKPIIRKSKDYVYGIWVYKALDIWKGYYRVKKSLVSYVKPLTEARNNKYMKYHSKLTYQLSFWNVSRKVDYHAGGKWFIHGPKRRKENQLLSLKHSCWLSLV